MKEASRDAIYASRAEILALMDEQDKHIREIEDALVKIRAGRLKMISPLTEIQVRLDLEGDQ